MVMRLPDQRNLEFVLAAWIIGVVMACILGCSRLRKLVPGPVSKPINWSWIRCGVRVGASFILGSLSLRAFYTIDRYWVEALGGLEVLAAYSLFMGIGNAIAAFLDAAVYSFSYPGIVSAVADGDESKFKNNIIRLLLHTVSFSLVLSFAAIVIAQPVIGALGRDIYSHYFCFLYWIVFSNVLFAISMTPHYALYAKGKDGAIVLTHVCSLLFFLLLVIATDGWLGVYAVPVSVTLSFMFLLFVKSVLFFRLFPTKCLGCYG
jgi:O-antigen/teichoic acid export membrane protein